MNSVNYSKLTQAECVQLFKDIISVSERQDLEALVIMVFYSRFKLIIDEVLEAYRPDNDREYTRLMVEFDHGRDECIVLLRSLSFDYSKHFKKEKAQAGKQLVDCIEKYGSNIQRQPYQVESSSLDQIYTELTTKPALKEAVSLLNLNEEVEEMKQYNDKFKEVRMDRVESQGKRSFSSFQLILDKGIKACRAYLNKIESASEFNEHLDYSVLIQELNVVIDEANTAALRRNPPNKGGDEETNLNI